MDFLKKLFSSAPAADFKDLVKKGAIVLDVRTRGEYSGGHVKGSINIPLNELPSNLNKLNKSKAIITCCASGMRSGSARSLLLSNGFNEVHNGGGWSSLEQKLGG
ncbi:MAG: rhodanese-like domain-containing protein [Bacteroidetes bacterium]|nr:rhodanese-like domain-containing protein [Bacteroidota bacterium]